MPIIHSLISWYLRKRENALQRIVYQPHDVQQEMLAKLLRTAKETSWGKQYGYEHLKNSEQFKREVPVGNYETHKPYIDRIMKGEQNVLWPSEIKWFAKSSGTTAAKSKFLPVTYESLDECHFQGGKDTLMMYILNNDNANVFDGKGLIIGGSHQLNRLYNDSFYGDLSAVMMQNMPFWAHFFRTPELSIAIMENWDEKINRMAWATVGEDVTNISGVPTWTLMLIDKLFEITGKKDLREIWPNLELYIHGGVSFEPYRERFKRLIKAADMHYYETYNASEGFLGIQYSLNQSDLLLMLDYGIYFEFMPMSEYGKDHPKTYDLHEVRVDENYALIISTNSGLSRYIIGDTVKFTSTNPYLFKITGRTRHFLNAFGEELIIENADRAITESCMAFNATLAEYTVAPIFHEDYTVGTHEWLIEFEEEPDNMEEFSKCLDQKLKGINSDYEAKRYNNIAMTFPIVSKLPKGTFHEWMKRNGKLGGQHKVPRLCNERTYVDEILSHLSKISVR